MKEFLLEYGLFLAETVTLVIAIGVVLALVIAGLRRARPQKAEQLEVTHLNKRYERMAQVLKKEILTKKEFIRTIKQEKLHKRAEAKKKKGGKHKPRKRIFVIDFRGDIKATAVASLREEITAILTLATDKDEVVVRLENAGGLVHEHGLAASQLSRIKHRGIRLTVAVDKVAASGGYLMACVADRIIAAPFAIIGSIGVLAQLPNFNRLLSEHGIDFEQIKAGEYKRTLTLFGVNTDEGRAKLQEQLEDTHTLLKTFIGEHRPDVDLAKVATGEYWHGTQALELKLVDALATSDDHLLAASETADLYKVEYTGRKTLSERLLSSVQLAAEKWLWARP